MASLINIKCDYCEKDFYKSIKHYNYNSRNGYRNFCSRKCSDLSKVSSIDTVCANCDKTISKKPNEFASSKSGNVFCSRTCSATVNNKNRVLDNNPNYRTGISSYRKRALEHYGMSCQACNWDEDPRILEVHHIDSNRKNNDIENLSVLCPTCHAKITLGYYELVKDEAELTVVQILPL